MKVQRYTFFGKPISMYKDIKEVPIFMKTSMIILAIICVTGGIFLYPKISGYLLDTARDVLVKGIDYSKMVFNN